MEHPVLVSGTDGVGTKLKLAFLLDKHDTVGIDCVAMCVNDVVCAGAKPLFFLDYIACGKNQPEKIASIVSGVAEGCVQAGCALIGGETAEMPGFYAADEYDLAGFTVGAVDKARITGPKPCAARRCAGRRCPLPVCTATAFPWCAKCSTWKTRKISDSEELGTTLWESLLTPTRIYVKQVLALMEQVKVKSVCHITGGGFYENIPRALPDGLSAKIEKKAVRTPPIFRLIQAEGNVPEKDMFNTYNMGVGMCCIVAKEEADRALEALKAQGEDAYVLGEVVESDEGVILW